MVWHFSIFCKSAVMNTFYSITLTKLYKPNKSITMLRWVIIFLVVALIAAVFGFGGIAAGAAGIAKIIFFIFIVLFVISLIMKLLR